MDPNACVSFILTSSAARPADIREHGKALRDWLARGGFPPESARFPRVVARLGEFAYRAAFLVRTSAEIASLRFEFVSAADAALTEAD